jgi:dienelactone hydrolase
MKKLEYTDGKTKFIGYLAGEDGGTGRRPGIVVFPEAFGLGDHAKKSAERLAKLGYVALAADINGEGAMYNDLAQLGPVIQSFYEDRSGWRARARAALDALRAQPGVDGARVAAIG